MQYEKNLFFINAGEQFLDASKYPITKLYRDDKLHYNIEGYKVWGNYIRKEVQQIAQLGTQLSTSH